MTETGFKQLSQANWLEADGDAAAMCLSLAARGVYRSAVPYETDDQQWRAAPRAYKTHVESGWHIIDGPVVKGVM